MLHVSKQRQFGIRCSHPFWSYPMTDKQMKKLFCQILDKEITSLDLIHKTQVETLAGHLNNQI